MKACLILIAAAFSCMLPVTATTETTALQQNPTPEDIFPNLENQPDLGRETPSETEPDLGRETPSETEPGLGTETPLETEPGLGTDLNLCAAFSQNPELEEDIADAPPPVRTLYDREQVETVSLDTSETILYQKLGLTEAADGSHVCLAKDPNNSRREFTIFKVKKINNILVVSTFLDRGVFMPGQETAATNLFLEMIRFYTSIPSEYHKGIKNYFQEFYLRMEDGRIPPSSERAYPVDEPAATVIMYHPLQGKVEGTGISLNIPLNQTP